jgi:23S rRNA pseudouridine1911/1915/1917 synthase
VRPARAYSGVLCTLHTGRTHQIRVHLSSRRHPLVADAVYGGVPALGMTRQALHATRLAFKHPVTGEALAFEAPLPHDMAAAWETLAASGGNLSAHKGATGA